MTKSLGTIITLTVMLVFIWGCQPEKEHTVALQQDGKPQIQHPDSEPKSQEAEPQELEPQQVELQEAEPEAVESEQAEPEQA